MGPSENGLSNREQAEALTELLLAQSEHQGVIFYDLAGVITGWSRGASFITGYSRPEAVGQPTALLFTPEDRDRGLDRHEIATALSVGAAEDERWHLRKDGSRFWSSGISLRLSRDDGAPLGFIKLFRDATHLRTRMKYLENTVAERHAERSRQRTLMATVAHELRGPLHTLHNAVQLLRAAEGHEESSGARPLQMMERQLGLLERLVEDLVDVTRAEVGKMSLAYQTVVLQSVLTDSMESCREQAEARGVALHLLLPSVPLAVEADPQRLHQVVVNLASNAIKFTDAEGDVWLSVTVDSTHFLLFVRDSGKGIEPELQPQIFNAFTQAGTADTSRGAGLGIGLSVVKEIVSLHGGTVEVRSEGAGKGSEFIVRIPLKRAMGEGTEPGADAASFGQRVNERAGPLP